MHNLKKIQHVADDIKAIKIQGATNIAKAAFEVMMQELKTQKFKSFTDLKSFVQQGAKLLMQARATEPMLFNGMKCALAQMHDAGYKMHDVKKIQLMIVKTLKLFLLDIQGEEKIRPGIGAKIIKKNSNIMTHCHSGSVVKTLVTARNQGKNIHVYNTETRPLFQGRRTSNDLIKAGVPDTMITDDSAPFFVDNLYESDVDIDMVIMGCDATKLDGSIYNKIGSFAIAMSAWHSKIPVYIVGSLTKVDAENTVKIEKRSGKELRSAAPKGLEIINYAFDMIPAKFITGIITEYGIIPPKDIKKYVKKYYPRMMT
ncbi:MAG: hypothetical protein WC875_05865 [Candidatus Absconditabacterales bacterium]